ncbi:MAG: class I SAM-dependent methyltransferase [Bryobacterales bacterium]
MGCEYHLAELKIALDPNDRRHIVPPPLPPSRKVLDVGCGAGQTLIAAYPERVSFGIDFSLEALKLGESLTQDIRFCQAKAEGLPFQSQQFDFVFSRVTLPLTKIRSALGEIRRVLKPDGGLWMTVHSPSMRWKRAKEGTWKAKCFFVYVAVNSLLFHFTQRQFSFFGRYDSFQTEKGITRALEELGFGGIEIVKNGELFLVTARTTIPQASIERAHDRESGELAVAASINGTSMSAL